MADNNADQKQNPQEQPPTPKDGEDGGKKEQGEKTYTEQELGKAISNRLDRERKKLQEQFNKTLEEKLEEASRLAKMDEEERKKAEADKLQAEIERKERELTKREMTLEAKSQLSSKNLPTELADFVIGEDAEAIESRIKTISSIFDTAVAKAVKEKMSGKTPDDPDKKPPQNKRMHNSSGVIVG